MNRLRVPALIVALAICLQGASHARKLYHVDEAPSRPLFHAFRERLIEAIRARDSAYLLSVIDPKIRVGFGDEIGIATFKQQGRPEDPKSPLWIELESLLTLGGTFDYGGVAGFWAPCVYTRWPEDVDAFTHVAVIRRDVTVRARPASDAPILARLSYDIVQVGTGDPIVEPHPEGPRTWRAIVTPQGKKGYVQALFLRSPIDYRARFIGSGRQWRMDLLVAGD
jgi:hypothetical protein